PAPPRQRRRPRRPSHHRRTSDRRNECTMGSNLTGVLLVILQLVRAAGLILLAIIGIGTLISEGAKSKLTPAKVRTVAGSASLAGVLIWLLPALISHARWEVNAVVPDSPVGAY